MLRGLESMRGCWDGKVFFGLGKSDESVLRRSHSLVISPAVGAAVMVAVAQKGALSGGVI